MGIFKNGLFGGISGRVGNIVGASWKGVEYVRSLPVNRVDPKTKKQIKQRNKMSVTMEFMKTVTPYVRVGFQMYVTDSLTAFNAAMSFNMKNAISTDADNVSLDYSKVMVSRGPLFITPNIKAERATGKIIITWDKTLSEDAKRSDQLMVVAYNSFKQQSVYDLNAGKRSLSSTSIEIPLDWIKDKIEVYLAFKDAEGGIVSDSVYVPISQEL